MESIALSIYFSWSWPQLHPSTVGSVPDRVRTSDGDLAEETRIRYQELRLGGAFRV